MKLNREHVRTLFYIPDKYIHKHTIIKVKKTYKVFWKFEGHTQKNKILNTLLARKFLPKTRVQVFEIKQKLYILM